MKDFKDLFNLEGKVAIVTGARRGMGRAHSIALSDMGARVVLCDIEKEECNNVVEEIRERGGEAFSVECDISKKEEVESMIEKTKEAYDGLDILVNNAGIIDFKNFFELAKEDWDRVIDVNLKGCFLCTQAAAQEMKENGGGSIINIGSVAMGQSGVGFPNTLPYVASKGGIAGMTEALAVDLAQYNIRVNLIAPGMIETLMTDPEENAEVVNRMISKLPMERAGKPEEVSGAVVFFASDASSYITGAMLNVDGGWLAA